MDMILLIVILTRGAWDNQTGRENTAKDKCWGSREK